MENFNPNTLIAKATETFRLLRAVEDLLGKQLPELWTAIEAVGRAIPSAQESGNGDESGYVYSDGDASSRYCVVSPRMFGVEQSGGQALIRLLLWGSNTLKRVRIPPVTAVADGVMTPALLQRLEDLEYNVMTKPTLKNRLMAAGYDEPSAEAVFVAYPRLNEAQVSLREGLRTINYSPQECEECLECAPELTLADVGYAKEIMDAFDPEQPDHKEMCKSDTRLVVFPKVDTSKSTSFYRAMLHCENLLYVPHLDFSSIKGTGLYQIFSWCLKLRRAGGLDIGPECTSIAGLFQNCQMLTSVGPLNFAAPDNITSGSMAFKMCWRLPEPPITDFHNMSIVRSFYDQNYAFGDLSGLTFTCRSEKSVDADGLFCYCGTLPKARQFEGYRPLTGVPRLEFANPKVALGNLYDSSDIKVIPDQTHMTPTTLGWLRCPYLERMEGWDFSELTSMAVVGAQYGSEFMEAPKLKYLRIINLGKSTLESYNLKYASLWGSGDAENLKSLVDTLLTDSYDRAANGMTNAQIRLDSAVLARLTAEQKAAITAKGFTLTN